MFAFWLITGLSVLFWISQLIRVIGMRDAEFEGHNDKLIFFILVFFGFIFGALGFFVWDLSRQARKAGDARIELALKESIINAAPSHDDETH